MSRAVSTVLDASLAVLLVSAAAVALVSIPGGDQRPPDPDAAARTVLASTATAEYQAANGSRRSVSGRAGTLLAHAALADGGEASPRFVRAVEAAVEEVLVDTGGRVLDADASRVEPAVRDRIASRATQSLVRDAGGVDELARSAVSGAQLAREEVVRPKPPEAVRKRAYREAAALREDARNVSADVSTRGLAAGRVPVDTLRDRVAALHDRRERYDSATDRAVAAVRAAYVARVSSRLGERRADGALSSVGEALGDRGLESPPTDHASERDAGPVASVEGAPAYLTLAEVTPRTAGEVEESYRPLAARNVNWFTVPHGDAAEAVVDAAMPEPPESVRLGTAAQALAAANGTLDAAPNGTLRRERASLQSDVAAGVSAAGTAYRGVLASSSLAFTERERRAATRFAFDRWETTHARGMAVGNGSAATALADEAARIADASPRERDRLATRLRAASADVADSERVRVDAGVVRDAADVTRRVGGAVAENALSEAGSVAAEKAAKRLGAADVGAVPAGLPLAPVPGFWYATANAWSVSVRGSYAEFAVRAEGGSPVEPGAGTAYVREDATVAFDVDGDGDAERIGRNERVSFEVEATVGVVVPAGPRGVGDVDGNADEQSAGW